MEELIKKVIEWASEKGIYENSTAEKQYELYLEETSEFYHALKSGNRDEIIMEYGDRVVTLINYYAIQIGADKASTECVWNEVTDILAMRGESSIRYAYSISIKESLEAAYNKISKRAGKMIDGKFTKESDL